MKRYLTFLGLTLLAVQAFAQAGNPDAAFDGDGYVVTDFHGSNDFGFAIAPHSNGDFLIGGDADSSGERSAAIARFNSNGTYDNQLATTGRRTISVAGGDVELWSLAIQSDDRFIGAGSTVSLGKALIFRMNPNGSLDGSFAQGGVFSHQTVGNDVEFLSGVVLQDDGKIVAVGSTGIGNDRDVIAFRLKTNGTPDSTFGGDGIVVIDAGAATDFANAVAIQPDGKIVIVGGSGDDILAIRLNSNGSLDASFDTDGRVTIDRGYTDNATAVALQNDGKIVISGWLFNGRDAAIILRLNSNGSLDNAFGQAGVVDTAILGNAGLFGLAIQPDGKVISGGRAYDGQRTTMLVVRLNPDGSFDNSWAQDGIFLSAFNNDDEAVSAVTLLADGRLATCGYLRVNSSYSAETAVFITGISVGLLDFTSLQNSILIYPNPVNSQLKLEFDLNEDTRLSIKLINLQGQLECELMTEQAFTKGANAVALSVPETVANGSYLLLLESKQGARAIRMQLAR